MKMVVFDIDDILADYTGCFLEYVRKMTDKTFGDTLEAKEILGRMKYAEIKRAYRAYGKKRDLSLMDDSAPKLISKLKKEGFEVAMVSSRPVEEHSRIYNDTFIWLAEKGFDFDYLLFSRHKHLLIFRAFRDYERCYIIEDDIFYARKIAEFSSFIVFWIANATEFQETSFPEGNIRWVNSLDNPLERIVNRILEEDNDSKTC